MRPQTLREVVERTRGDGEWDHHLREFLDTFYAHDGDAMRQRASIEEEPGLLGVARADAFIGGAGEHLARRWRHPVPGWVRNTARYLTTAMFVPDERPLRPRLLVESPVAFRSRLIFTSADPLQRARFPYRRGTISFAAE